MVEYDSDKCKGCKGNNGDRCIYNEEGKIKHCKFYELELERIEKEPPTSLCSTKTYTLPGKLDQIIFCGLGGIRKPLGRQYGKKTDMESWKYDGTYTPLSLIEGYDSISDLLKNNVIRNMFREKEQIRILDVGSGSGGYSIGAFWALKFLFPSKPATIFSIDENQEYLDNFDTIHSYLFPKSKKPLWRKFTIYIDKQLILPKVIYESKWDIIISSKFLLELFDENKPEVNPWKLFVKESESLLESGGFLLINEVEKPMVKLEDGTVKHFVTDELKKGLKEYLTENDQLRICFPMPCSQLFPHKCKSRYCKPFREYNVISNYRKKEALRHGRIRERVEKHPSTKVINYILAHKDAYDLIYENEKVPERFPVTYPLFDDGIENKVCNVGSKATCKGDSHHPCNSLYVFNDICAKYKAVD